MAGQELASEGFAKGQVGSSAMPHKVNARNCERVCGFSTILSGHVTMTANLAGHQWNEGDVSCSVVRRVALPDAVGSVWSLLDMGDGSVNTLRFSDDGDGKTTLTLLIQYNSKEARDAAVSTGMTDGMETSYQSLDALLAKVRA